MRGPRTGGGRRPDVAVRRRRGDGATSLPLFPLRTVLFPGGLLPLKVFEQRYIEMTKACLATAARSACA